MKNIRPLLLMSLLSACSSIVEGTSQKIAVNTTPADAKCSLERDGVAIADVNPTPGTTKIEKTKHDIAIRCNKDGFEEATYLNHSGLAAATFGNILIGGLVGWGVDSALGADNKYDSHVNITMVKSGLAGNFIPEEKPQENNEPAPTPVIAEAPIAPTKQEDSAAPAIITEPAPTPVIAEVPKAPTKQEDAALGVTHEFYGKINEGMHFLPRGRYEDRLRYLNR